MGTFLGFLLVGSFIVWGTALTALHLRRQLRGTDQGANSDVVARLLEDMDQLSTRLSRVEEELDFFKELRAPETRSRLSPPGSSSDGKEEGREEDGVEGEGEA